DAETTDNAVLLHICDSGPGVPEEIRSKLFEPFASRSPGGTGLGLAIVARVVARMGGTLGFERYDGRHAVRVTLPRGD
ncbi:MAG: HAMP domain-containing histidine kinase, partial [Rhizobacter sp.]|nr:HAMP domain-containing histidine kinase [Rhizobacter sp.]